MECEKEAGGRARSHRPSGKTNLTRRRKRECLRLRDLDLAFNVPSLKRRLSSGTVVLQLLDEFLRIERRGVREGRESERGGRAILGV